MSKPSTEDVKEAMGKVATLAVESGMTCIDFMDMARPVYIDANTAVKARQARMKEIDDQIAELQKEKQELAQGSAPANKKRKTSPVMVEDEDTPEADSMFVRDYEGFTPKTEKQEMPWIGGFLEDH